MAFITFEYFIPENEKDSHEYYENFNEFNDIKFTVFHTPSIMEL